MDVRIKAGLEVAGFVAVTVFGAVGGMALCDYLIKTYGDQAVRDGIVFSLLFGAMYFILGTIYDIRLAQYRYKAKLEEMTSSRLEKIKEINK